jgi:hypothetical protein
MPEKTMCRQWLRTTVQPARQLALSCHPIWLRHSASICHRSFPAIASNGTLFGPKLRCGAKWLRSETLSTLPCSSTAVLDCMEAVFEPSRHMSLSDLRGIITGTRACSAVRRHRQDIVLPVVLVCIIPLPLSRTSLGRQLADMLLMIMS